jgi:hypothetical protein
LEACELTGPDPDYLTSLSKFPTADGQKADAFVHFFLAAANAQTPSSFNSLITA